MVELFFHGSEGKSSRKCACPPTPTPFVFTLQTEMMFPQASHLNHLNPLSPYQCSLCSLTSQRERKLNGNFQVLGVDRNGKLPNGHRVSVWKDEEGLEICCTTV